MMGSYPWPPPKKDSRSLWDKIMFKVKYDRPRPIHSFIEGINNLIYWFPVIWKDRWWDHYFLSKVLRHKLAQMEKGFREKGNHTLSERDADNVKYCVLLLDRILESSHYNYTRFGKDKNYKEYEAHEQQDYDLLFKRLNKHYRSWWD